MNKILDLPSESAIIINVPSTMIVSSNPAEENKCLKERIQELESLVESLQTTILNQQHQMEGLIKRLYGRSSEKLDPNQLLMQELILEADKNGVKTEKSVEPIHKTVVAAHTRNHHGRQTLPEHLKRVEHLLDAKDKDKPCDCGKNLCILAMM